MLPWVLASAFAMLGFLIWLAISSVTAIAFRGDYRTLIDFAITSPKLMFQTRAKAFYVAGKADNATTTRGLASRILLLSATYSDNGMTALIIGDIGDDGTGTQYDLVFSDSPSCSCEFFKFKREAQCKHLAWLKTKVLGIPAAHYLITQTSYLAVEVFYILSRPRRAAAPALLVASRPIREALGVIPKEPVGDSSASVCNFGACEDESPIVLCAATCRYAVCDGCVKRYHKSLAEEGKPPICPGCLSPWVSEISVHAVTLRTRKQTLKVTHPFGSRAASRGRAASRV